MCCLAGQLHYVPGQIDKLLDGKATPFGAPRFADGSKDNSRAGRIRSNLYATDPICKNLMSIRVEIKDLINPQEMEVAVNGPDGATHLILCMGVANLRSSSHETYTFLVGPQISRRQFVGAIASGALSTIQGFDKNLSTDHAFLEVDANLVLIDATYDDEAGQVKVSAEVSCGITVTKLAISYNVSILAELPSY